MSDPEARERQQVALLSIAGNFEAYGYIEKPIGGSFPPLGCVGDRYYVRETDVRYIRVIPVEIEVEESE